jgi:hypothetical protein
MEINIVKTRKLLSDIYNRKFIKTNGNITSHDIHKIKLDNNFILCKNTLEYYYYEMGYGIKFLIKDLKLNITPPVLRKCLIKFFDIKLRENNVITDNLRKLRKEKALFENKNKIGFGSIEVQTNIKNKNSTNRGIQGYYYNKFYDKNVWLRSSWEYIYAKWLDSNNIKWDIECKTYILNDSQTYRPDFFIFDENEKMIKIVEIKGYWKDKVWKYTELKSKLDIELILITDIKNYTISVNKDYMDWKKINKKYEN